MSSVTTTATLGQVPSFVFAAYFGLFGLVVGSYLNVVAYRLPLGVSTVAPKSRCPRCLMPIRPWHNVPVFGWLALRGRCRDCRVPISIRYPATEALTGALFVLAWSRFEPWLGVAAAAAFCALFVVLAAIDIDHHLLPVWPMRIGTLAAVALQPWLGWVPPAEAVVAAVGGAGLIAVLSALWRRRVGEEGFGHGDVEMMAFLGSVLGAEGALAAFVLAAVAALGGLLLARSKGSLKSPAGASSPFGAWLAIAAIVVLMARGG